MRGQGLEIPPIPAIGWPGFLGLDNACYPAAGGRPSDSRLGMATARNDRWLHAHLRRSWVVGFPLVVDGPPTVAAYSGCDLGAWPLTLSPGCEWVDWYLRADVVLGDEWRAAAYVLDDRRPALGAVQTFAGTGAPHTYGPIPVQVSEGQHLVGVVVWSLTTTVTPAITGAVLDLGDDRLRAAAGAFAALPVPPAHAVALSDVAGWPAGGAPLVGGPWSAVGVTADVAASDTIVWHPGRAAAGPPASSLPAAGAYYYQVWPVTALTLYGILAYERPLTGTMASRP